MTNSILLEREIKRSGYTRQHIMDVLGWRSYQTLQRKLKGCVDFTQSEIVAMQRLLSLSDERVKEIFFDIK